MYQTVLSHQTYQRAQHYLEQLQANPQQVGNYLQNQLQSIDLASLTTERFLKTLLRTKLPHIYAESDVHGDGRDWNLTELGLLGDISMVLAVDVYDNGIHTHPHIHPQPFHAHLVYTPGALLRNNQGQIPADWIDIVKDEQLDVHAFYQLYERRLLPPLRYLNQLFEHRPTQALITIPGLGCGLFAGPFKGQLGSYLKQTLERLLQNHHNDLAQIRAVYYDPYQECQNERVEIGHISFLTRPFLQGNQGKPQLCLPKTYEDTPGEFSHCELVSVVAWDHVSWPGNDYYRGNRATDDGVKAAATNTMAVMTGIDGHYERELCGYVPPEEFTDWNAVIEHYQHQLHVNAIIL